MVFLRSLSFNGLYSYGKETHLDFSDQTVIVGPNNSGKSNIIRIIRLLFETFSPPIRYLQDWEIHAGSDNLILEAKITLSREEIERMIDFFSFFREGPNRDSQYYQFKNLDFFRKNLDEVRIKLTWVSSIQGWGAESIIEFEFEKIDLNLFSRIYGPPIISNKKPANLDGYSIIEGMQLAEFLDKLSLSENPKDYINDTFESAGGKILVADPIDPRISTNMPEKGRQIIKNFYALLGLRSGGNNYVQFLHVIGAILRGGLHHTTERRNLAKGILDYVELLKTEEEEFDKKLIAKASSQTLYHADKLENDGSNLASFLFSLKVSKDLEERERLEDIKNAFEDLVRSENLSFDVHLEYQLLAKSQAIGSEEYLKPQFPSIVIVDNDLKKQYPLDKTGSGLHELVYLLTLAYGIKNSIILLDEPSVNLHPPLMKSLMKSLEKSENSNQFIIITHSPELTHYEMFEGRAVIFYVRKSNHASTVSSLNEELRKWFEENKGRFKHQIDSRIFFGKCIVLTEGESDRNLLGIASYFDSVDNGLDPDRYDVAITSVGGKENFTKYRRYLDGFEIPYIILADSNAKSLFESYGTISKDSINQNGPIFVIENGNLEDLMKEIDIDVYSAVEKEFRGSKPTIAFEFAKKVAEKNPTSLNTIKSFLQVVIDKAKSNSSGND